MRRLRIHYEEDALVEVDMTKLTHLVGELSPFRIERAVERIIRANPDGHTLVDDVGGRLTDVEREMAVELEELCEKHGVWYAVSPASQASCWQCKGEARGAT